MDICAGTPEAHRHQIDPGDAAQTGGVATYQIHLRSGKGEEGIGGDGSRLRDDTADLDHRPFTVDEGHEVDLSTLDRDIPGQNPSSGALQHPGDEPLACPAYRPAMGGSIGAPGSSSSMLTSRKVKTRTVVRNRAGRYMSHTHASSSSSSK